MKSEMPKATWTDERLDDLNRRVETGFAEVKVDLRDLRAEVARQGTELREEIREQRAEVNARFDAAQMRTDAQLNALHRLIVRVGGGGIAAMLLGFVGLVVSHA